MQIPGYQLQEQLSRSGATEVFRASEEETGRPVILKLLAQTHPLPEEVAWFRREFEIVQRLHSGTDSSGAVHGVVEPIRLQSGPPGWMMVLEDFGGESLERTIRSGPLPAGEFLPLALQLVKTLGDIHQRGVIHKDLNPSNLVFNRETGEVKVIDFGQSTALSQERANPAEFEVLEGTLAYISPEQTGRMNRAVDYRSDYYSLGVSFYELLTGQLPFPTEDPLTVIHAHLAQMPAAPHEVRPDIPATLGEITLKLMAKNAEDRYQSAVGILADLERCWQQLQEIGRIENFPLGQADVSGRLHLPEKLYGREVELDTLLRAYERAAGGESGLLLVEGPAGIGKTALVRELYKPVTRRQGYFLSGKFDQLERNTPYLSLTQGFSSLVRQLLTESESDLAGWRERLQGALGPNGRVILDLLPEMRLIIGEQPEVPELPAAEAQQRFNLVFRNFVRVFAQRDHPLAIFLDDLQWADAASLRLLKLLLTDPDIRYLFVIGAYRDREVSPTHPLSKTVDDLGQAAVIADRVRLGGLAAPDVTQFIIDSLGRTPAEAGALAEMTRAKTDGNPFFMNEFLKRLHAEGLLRFDQPTRAWTWDLAEIQGQQITDNVVELMADKVRTLPSRSQEVLMLAASIGGRFDLQCLSLVHEHSPEETGETLWPAVSEGLILPLSRSYQLIGHGLKGQIDLGNVEFAFSHDRIQQAVYSLLPADQKAAIHYRIGRMLLENTPDERKQGAIFDIAGQLNLGSAMVQDPEERIQLARLNLQAGRRAKASAAYDPALGYLQAGLRMLDGGDWETQYDLTLALHNEAAEAALLAPDFEAMHSLVATALAHARTPLDKSRAFEVRIQAGFAQNQPLEAVRAAREILKLLGVRIPERPGLPNLAVDLILTMLALIGKRTDRLIDLPSMEDPEKKAALRILTRVAPGVYIAVPELVPLSMLKMVRLSVRGGNAPASAFAYVGYGLLQCGVLGNPEAGDRYGRLGLALVERLDAKRYQAAAQTYYHTFVQHWNDHLRETLQPLADTFQVGLETGDAGSASIAALIYGYHAYFAGRELAGLEREIHQYSQAMQQLNQDTTRIYNEFFRQVILNLLGETSDPCVISGESYDVHEMLPRHLEVNDRSIIWNLYWNQLVLCYLFGDYESAVDNANRASEYLDSAVASYSSGAFRFYDSLARLALYPDATRAQQRSILRKVSANEKQLRKWARTAPMNYLNKLALIQAERARVTGAPSEAGEAYDRAIDLATTHGFIQEAALAGELAAHFYLANGRRRLAQVYATQAHAAYQQWGATAKVRHLAARFPDFLATIPVDEPAKKPTTVTPKSRASSELELTSVLRASQAISDQIILHDLLSNLMRIVLQNAGAERGSLILEREGRWLIEAAGSIEQPEVGVLQGIPLTEGAVPVSLVNYVLRTREQLVLDDVSHSEAFAEDPYFQRGSPKSVLCMPLLHQGRMIGLLYLENHLTAGAFTPDRLEVLALLSSQAAISIENATLYSSLERKVEERTAQLADATRQAEQARTAAEQANESKSAFLANVSHELRTPLTSVIGFAKIIQKRFAEKVLPAVSGDAPATGRAIDQINANIDIVIQEGERLTTLIDHLLDVAKIEAGKLEWRMEPLSILDIVERATAATSSLLTEKNLELHMHIPADLPQVEGDRDRLIQVLINLISNAVKFTDQGGVTCRARLEGDELIITVTDTGIGISPDELTSVFEKFVQVGETLTDKPRGTGLGLPISKQIIEHHGGRIWVESVSGEGSSFAFTLPVMPDEEQKETGAVSVALDGSSGDGRHK